MGIESGVRELTFIDYKLFISAAEEGNIKVLLDQIACSVDVNVLDAYGDTALIKSSRNGHYQCVQILLENGADPNKPAKNKTTPLIEAAGDEDNQPILVKLLKAGANVNHHNDDGWTALIGATQAGCLSNMSLLIDYGADLNFVNSKEESAVTYSVVWGHYKCLDLLIRKGAEFDRRDSFGWTPLVYAVREESFEVVKILIQNGANLNTIDNDGTPLIFHAIRYGRIEIVKEIFRHPLYRHKTDRCGKTALDIVHDSQDQDMIDLLGRGRNNP